MSDIRLAIYDQFFVPDTAQKAQHPFWEAAIDSERHDVVAHASNLGEAMLSLVAMKQKEAVVPDVIVVAGRLVDDHQYIENPTAVPTDEVPAVISKRRLFSKPSQIEGRLLLPTTGRGGEVELPAVKTPQRAFDLERALDNYHALLNRHEARSTPAMFIVSHVAKLYLPEHPIRIIGVSGMAAPSDRIPLDGFVGRDSDGADRLQRLAAGPIVHE